MINNYPYLPLEETYRQPYELTYDLMFKTGRFLMIYSYVESNTWNCPLHSLPGSILRWVGLPWYPYREIAGPICCVDRGTMTRYSAHRFSLSMRKVTSEIIWIVDVLIVKISTEAIMIRSDHVSGKRIIREDGFKAGQTWMCSYYLGRCMKPSS